MKLCNVEVKPHFVHLLLWHEKCRALNLIHYFSSYLDPSVCPRIHAFFLSTNLIFNKSSLIQFYTLFLICLKSVNFGHHFLYVRSRFFFSIVNPWPGFLWFFFQHINCLSIALKCFAHQDDSKGHRPEIHFFMKSYFIFLTYLNPLSMLSSLNFFKLGRESKVSYVKHSHFLIIFWPWPFFLLNLIWHQGF